jgi:hypothetical protein
VKQHRQNMYERHSLLFHSRYSMSIKPSSSTTEMDDRPSSNVERQRTSEQNIIFIAHRDDFLSFLALDIDQHAMRSPMVTSTIEHRSKTIERLRTIE